MSPAAGEIEVGSEHALAAEAGRVAGAWLEHGVRPLVVGLRGDLGAGKTSWVRALLRSLGYAGRVPSPTYTLVEQYDGLPERLVVIHADLYRLTDELELENLGLRDRLAEPDVWLFVEWPERAPAFAATADLVLDIAITGPVSRRLGWTARTPAGDVALRAISDSDSN